MAEDDMGDTSVFETPGKKKKKKKKRKRSDEIEKSVDESVTSKAGRDPGHVQSSHQSSAGGPAKKKAKVDPNLAASPQQDKKSVDSAFLSPKNKNDTQSGVCPQASCRDEESESDFFGDSQVRFVMQEGFF